MADKKHLIFGGCDTVELAERFGTPLYVLSEEKIRSRCRRIRENFMGRYPRTRAVYASKAFLTLAMCRIIEDEGLGLDVVSGGEIHTAVRAGFPMERVFFHGNNKTSEELEYAMESGVGRIVVDSMDELELLERLAAERNAVVSVLFRLTPGVDAHTHRYIATGQTDSKFGMPLLGDGLRKAVMRAEASSYLDLRGFHFHVGSQLRDNRSHLLALEVLAGIIETLSVEMSFVTRELNVGGGFGVAGGADDESPDVSYFTDALMEKLAEECRSRSLPLPEVAIEPGRWIVSEAGITLYRVGTIKDIPGVRTYVSVDGGMTDNPRPALYGAEYWCTVANRQDEDPSTVVTVAGKCCETGDVIMRDVSVPSMKPGDILAVFNTGAYNFSMASNYNRLPRPAVVLVGDGDADVIVERQTWEDLLRGDRIPERLKK